MMKEDSKTLTSSSSSQCPGGEIPLIFPERLANSKVLFELPSSKDAFETDLSGDTGAVGRFIVQKGKGGSKLQLDFKGAVYDGEPMILAGSCMIVSVALTGAKVETVFNDYVRLTKDVSITDNSSDVLDLLVQDDEDENALINPSSNVGKAAKAVEGDQEEGEGSAPPLKRKRELLGGAKGEKKGGKKSGKEVKKDGIKKTDKGGFKKGVKEEEGERVEKEELEKRIRKGKMPKGQEATLRRKGKETDGDEVGQKGEEKGTGPLKSVKSSILPAQQGTVKGGKGEETIKKSNCSKQINGPKPTGNKRKTEEKAGRKGAYGGKKGGSKEGEKDDKEDGGSDGNDGDDDDNDNYNDDDDDDDFTVNEKVGKKELKKRK